MDKDFRQNKLEAKGNGPYKPPRVHGRRFLTALDMSIAKHDEAVRNARVKRGEDSFGTVDHIIVCSCGKQGCMIHTSSRNA